MLLNSRYSKQRRNRHVVFVNAPIRKDDDIEALGRCPVHPQHELVQSLLEGSVPVVDDGDDLGPKTRLV